MKPVITLLSPSIAASRRAQSLLSAASCFREVPLSVSDDSLDNAFHSVIPGFSRTWDSAASICDVTGAVIHFCSMASAAEIKKAPFSLLGMTESASSNGKVNGSVQQFRNLLATHIDKRTNRIKMKHSMGTTLTSTELLRSLSAFGLPILSLPRLDNDDRNAADSSEQEELGLKEIVIPYFDQASYVDGSTIASKISESHLTRTTVGVYRWPNSGVSIRPLPTAAEDQVLPPPSLIFHCTNPDVGRIQDTGIKMAKIGFGGSGKGQLMLLHDDVAGIDIRYCPKPVATPFFCEAQDSLMAGSLVELQSANALLSGSEKAVHDNKIGNSDCWIEVRANLKKPAGFLKRSASTTSSQRIAKIPDLPYE